MTLSPLHRLIPPPWTAHAVGDGGDAEYELEAVPEGETFTFRKARDYTYKTTDSRESFVFFVRAGAAPAVYYNQINNHIRLTKRRDKVPFP